MMSIESPRGKDLERGLIPLPSEDPTEIFDDLAEGKKSMDLAWAHVNFSVGKKEILSDCWGEVR
jgi:hypothetical protein